MPGLIGRYAETFHPRFAALSGSEAQTKEVATAYKVYFEKVPVRATDQCSIDHTSVTYVLTLRAASQVSSHPARAGREWPNGLERWLPPNDCERAVDRFARSKIILWAAN